MQEEDFTTNLFGLSLYEEYADSVAVEELETVMIRLQTMIRESSDSDQDSKRILSVIYDRLDIRMKYLLALYHLSQAQCSQLDQAKEKLQSVLDMLKNKKDIIEIGTTKGEEIEGGTRQFSNGSWTCARWRYALPLAFDPNINRKLTAQAPPRPITLPSNQEVHVDVY